jgi:hypothetical protein
MGFKGILAGIGGVLFCAATASAQSSITVLVNDGAGVEAGILRKAEAETARLFAATEISIRWVHCAASDACRRSPLPNEFVLHIIATGRTHSEFTFGEAFLGEDGLGRYSDLFFDRIRAARADIDTGRLLGAVAAHELGHLLLGSHAHSRFGIMQPVWEQDCVHKLGKGMLMFTADQAGLMRQRVGEADRMQPGSLAKKDALVGMLTERTLALRF